MSRRDPELAAHLYRCRCGAPADYACETGKVTPPRRERRQGVDVVVQDFETYHLCSSCATSEAASDAPPRSITALAHHDERLRRAEAARRRERQAEARDAQASLGDDWGRP